MLLIIENNNSINRIDRKLSKSIILFTTKINRDCSSISDNAINICDIDGKIGANNANIADISIISGISANIAAAISITVLFYVLLLFLLSLIPSINLCSVAFSSIANNFKCGFYSIIVTALRYRFNYC